MLKSRREAVDVLLEVTLVTEELHVGAVNLDLALLALGNVFLAAERSEAPVLADDDLLAARELVFISKVFFFFFFWIHALSM